jgi:hypothetical protein
MGEDCGKQDKAEPWHRLAPASTSTARLCRQKASPSRPAPVLQAAAAPSSAHLEEALADGAARVHHALRDALAVKVGQLLGQLVVLQQDGATWGGGHGGWRGQRQHVGLSGSKLGRGYVALAGWS